MAYPKNQIPRTGFGSMLAIVLQGLAKHPDNSIVLENFSPITNKTATKGRPVLLKNTAWEIYRAMEPKGQHEERWEQQFPGTYRNTSAFAIRRRELYDIFSKHYEFDKKFCNRMDRFIPNNARVLGVHLRVPMHYGKTNYNEYIAIFTDELDRHETAYTHIFVATHTQETLDLLKERYKGKVIHLTHAMNAHKGDWHEGLDVKKVDQTRIDLFEDVYILSKCNCIIGGMSNVFYTALVLNPALEFILPSAFDTMKSG